MTVKEINERAQRVHKEAVVIQFLDPIVVREEGVWKPQEIEYFKTLVDAGVTAINATAVRHDDLAVAISRIAELYKAIEDTEKAIIPFTAADIESAKKEGKVAVILGMQNPLPFEGDLNLLRVFYRLGLRITQLAYDRQSYLGAGGGESVDHGLTDQGREAVKELNRLGILIDVSHGGDQTAMDAAKASEYPIAITHATPSAIVEMRRGRSDEVIKAVAEKGGVFGQAILTPLCERRDRMGVRPTLNDYVDIIDYVVNLVGVDHVGLGFDWSPFLTKKEYDRETSAHTARGNPFFPHKWPPIEELCCEGFNSISDIVKITEELLRHGYSDDEAKKILGGNWLRLVKEVWK